MLQLILGVVTFFLCMHGLMYGYMNPTGMLTAMMITLACYLPHELAHMSFGGTYKFSPVLAIMSILCSFLGIPFVAVGYVDYKTAENMVAKASAGVIANIIIAMSSLITSVYDSRVQILVYPSLIFAWSNMLPVEPLDGAILFQKSKMGWSIAFGILTLVVLCLKLR